MKYLGETIDIHAGGEDNMFPHHENEIAQSEAATGKKFVNYWMHTKHVLMNGEKMSKSKGNFLFLKDAIEKYTASLVRLFFLTTHYRKNIDFNENDLLSYSKVLDRIKSSANIAKNYSEKNEKSSDDELLKNIKKARNDFTTAMDDDFNTSLAIKIILEISKETANYYDKNGKLSRKTAEELFSFFKETLQVLLGDLFESEIISDNNAGISEGLIELLISIRDKARKNKDYKLSDNIRDELKKSGVILKDSRDSSNYEFQ
jgi:cysteinyl-tRNA synthetase